MTSKVCSSKCEALAAHPSLNGVAASGQHNSRAITGHESLRAPKSHLIGQFIQNGVVSTLSVLVNVGVEKHERSFL